MLKRTMHRFPPSQPLPRRGDIPCRLLAGLLWALMSQSALSDFPGSDAPAVFSAGRHAVALALNPVGYWPADAGEGNILRDLSPVQNHGRIHHVPWDTTRDLLDFTSAFQWLEIPAHAAYQTPAITMGGWMFTRSTIIGGWWRPQGGVLLIGNRGWTAERGVQLIVRRDELLNFISNGEQFIEHRREFGRTGGQPTVVVGKWQHVLYSFDPHADKEEAAIVEASREGGVNGTGRLYLNGRLVAEKKNVTHRPVNTNLQIGNDAGWWHQLYISSGSLDGSVRDMVWFDRVLSNDEVRDLHRRTQPGVEPKRFAPDALVIDQVHYQNASVGGREVHLEQWAGFSSIERRQVLEALGRWGDAMLRQRAAELMPVLSTALEEPNSREYAVQLLIRLKSKAAQSAQQAALPDLLAVVQDSERSERERADAALALAAMGVTAKEAVPVLVGVLNQQVPSGVVEAPRTEELLRNAVTRALLDIAPDHEQARRALEHVYAGPLMRLLDPGNQRLSQALRTRLDDGAFMDAMRLHARLPRKARERYFTYKPPEQRDYTGTAHFNGVTYKVGTGVAWRGTEAVPEREYREIVAELAETCPEVKEWREPDYKHLYRVPLTRIDADGNEQRIYLEGRHFILDGADEKLRGWSIFIDELGYIHLTGGQHNRPFPHLYILGSWERMGVSRDPQSDEFPAQMYWISAQPECIDSFEFAGRKNDPRAIPADYLNYMVFEQSLRNETYLYGRINSLSLQSWGLFRYVAADQRWLTVGGDPFDLMESARAHHPAWLDLLHSQIRGRVPAQPTTERPLVWAWQPAFYNFCRDEWGIRFDKTNRMHLRKNITGLNERGYLVHSNVYAWSDDGGQSFYRADGTPVRLPLTINPAPEHNADIQKNDNGRWGTLWLSLLRDAGFSDVPATW